VDDNREDFRNEKVDSGEIGMGHSVTALYEIIQAGTRGSSFVDRLKYQASVTVNSSEFAAEFIKMMEQAELLNTSRVSK